LIDTASTRDGLALNAAGWSVDGHDQRGHARREGARCSLAHDDKLLADLAAVHDGLQPHEVMQTQACPTRACEVFDEPESDAVPGPLTGWLARF